MSFCLAIFDTETTGVTEADDIVQIACLLESTGVNEVDALEGLANPGMPIPPQASRVHGITDDAVRSAPPSGVVVNAWLQAVLGYYQESGADQLILAGHNVQFDIRMVQRHVSLPASALIVDTLQLAHRVEPLGASHKLSDLYRKYKQGEIDYSQNAHDALADCWMVRDLLLGYCQTLQMGLEAVAKSLQEPRILECMPFGKWKGVRFDNIPVGYANWALQNLTGLNPDVVASLEYVRMTRGAGNAH